VTHEREPHVSLEGLYGVPTTPQEEAEFAACNRISEAAPENIRTLAVLLLLVQRGAHDYMHRALGCSDLSHLRILDYIVEVARYLHRLGVTQEQYDAATELLGNLVQAQRNAG